MARTIVFRVSKPFQEIIVNYLHERGVSLAELIKEGMAEVCDRYGKYLDDFNDVEGKEFWKRENLSVRFSTKLYRAEELAKLRKISELTGRSVSDLIKEGIWRIIKERGGE
jgi:Cft2 family RNA processing exonuclease